MLVLVYIFFPVYSIQIFFSFHCLFNFLSIPLVFCPILLFLRPIPLSYSTFRYLKTSSRYNYLSFHTLYDSVCLSAFFSFSISLFLSITHSFFFLSISLFLETLSKGTRPPNLLCSQAASEFHNSN